VEGYWGGETALRRRLGKCCVGFVGVEFIIHSRWYRTLFDFCPCPRLIRHFGGVSQAVCTLSSAYRQALGKKVFGTIWKGYY
jgi:hypothetical protein